jgi:type IV secretory pathway TraG/TraD family ATPase VirD4
MQQSRGSSPYGGGFAERRNFMPHEKYVFEGVFFGKSSEPGPAHLAPFAQHQGGPICSTPRNHSLIIAPAATGKFTRVCAPTLLRGYLSSSALVIDARGENAAVTARARQSAFHGLNAKVHILNPWNLLAPTFTGLGFEQATYNPLDVLDRNDRNAVAIAQAIAAAICPKDKGSTDAFWSTAAASFLTAVLLWLTDNTKEQKTLARAQEILWLSQKDFKENFLVQMTASNAFEGAIREHAAPFNYLADETYTGVMGILGARTKFLSDRRIKAATATSSFSMADLMKGPTTVYVVIPPEQRELQRTWLRLIITAAMQTYKYGAAGNVTRCLFLIDEFQALGHLDELPHGIATIAGHGMDFALVVQSIDQLKQVYGDAHATILSNCAYQWFCNINDLQTAQYLSQALGSGGGTGAGLTPKEILNLGRDTAILLAPGDKPHYLRTVDYWDLPSAFGPPLEYDPSPYHEP